MSGQQVLWWAVEVLKAATPLAIGVIAGLIAYQQWRTANNKLNLDLFDKRYRIYRATDKFWQSFLSDFTITDDEYRAFRKSTKHARFLFDPDVAEYLYQIGSMTRKSTRELFWMEQARVSGDMAKHEKWRLSHEENMRWSVAQNLESKFLPFMDFSTIKATQWDALPMQAVATMKRLNEWLEQTKRS